MNSDESRTTSILSWGPVGCRWVLYALVFAGMVLLADLYFFQIVVQDPGYFVVARHSDTPDQVVGALDQLDLGTVSDTDLRLLRGRYQRKMKSRELSPGEREKWHRAYRETRQLIRAREDSGED